MKTKATSVLMLAIVFTVYYSFRHDVITLDGLQGDILSIFFKPDTRYSTQYTHHKFTKLHKGMTEPEVLELLGEPLARWMPYRNTNFRNKAHYIGFQYSDSPSDTHYRLRQVYFDNGKVAEIISYYYID